MMYFGMRQVEHEEVRRLAVEKLQVSMLIGDWEIVLDDAMQRLNEDFFSFLFASFSSKVLLQRFILARSRDKKRRFGTSVVV